MKKKSKKDKQVQEKKNKRMTTDWYVSKNAFKAAVKMYGGGLFHHEQCITIGHGDASKEFLVFKGSRGGKKLVTPEQFDVLTATKNKKNMKRNRSGDLVTSENMKAIIPPPPPPSVVVPTSKDTVLLPSIQSIVGLKEAVSRIPGYMRAMGSQHLVEYAWNEKHGCYNVDHRGYTDLDEDMKQDYEYQQKNMEKLGKIAREATMNGSSKSDVVIQRMCRKLIKMVEGETSFGLIFSYGELDVSESDFAGIEAIFLRVVKSIPDVVYKIMPVLVCEKHECSCENGEDYEYENDCGCSCEVYSVSPEDINYTLNTKPKDRYMNHPHPIGGGNMRFYVIRGQGFGHDWDNKQNIDNITTKRTRLQRAIVITSFEASAHKKRKYANADAGEKATKEK